MFHLKETSLSIRFKRIKAREVDSPMSRVKQALFLTLQKKGIAQGLIPGFLRSLSNHFTADPHMDLIQLNHKLQTIGWDEIELDYHTFELAKTWLEAEGQEERPYTPPHVSDTL